MFVKAKEMLNLRPLKTKKSALAVPGGPWHLAFAPKQLENLSFPIEIIYWVSWISHVHSTGLPLFFLRAKPCLKKPSGRLPSGCS